MKNKILAILLAMVMLLGMLPMTAFAAEGNEASVTINGETAYHETLSEAILAVQNCTAADNAIVTLLKEVNVSERQNITAGTFTLDLNGFEIAGTIWALYISGGNVTINDSRSGGTISGYYAVYAENSTLTVLGGTINGGAVGVDAKDNNTVTIAGGSIKGGNYGVNVGNSTVTISDGTISGDDYGVVVSYSTATISGGNIVSEKCGINVYSGTLEFSNGIVEGKEFYGIEADESDVIISGGEISGYVDAVIGRYTTLTISGGTLNGTGENSGSVYASCCNSTITGGTISGANYDLYSYDGTVALTLAEGDDEGAIFPDGLTVGNTTLKAILGEGIAYWQNGKQIPLTDDQTEIAGGTVTVKAARGLVITGGTAGTYYTYENGVLDIKAAGTYEIKNADPATTTGDIIKVSAPEGSTVNITLSGVNIDVSNTGNVTVGTDGLCAFEITANSTTNITLKDGTANILKSGVHKAGLQNKTYPLTISCEHREETNHQCGPDCGALEAVGSRAAGIGGQDGKPADCTDGSNITIHGGNLTAKASEYGAGIGGAYGKNGDNILITGGVITAIGERGAGIGGGQYGNGSDITISGGTVISTSTDGAGIGGGDEGNGSDITISGGTVTATGEHGAGIGGGNGGNGSNITISGGTVTATGEIGAGIGGGNEGNGSNITISGGTVTATGERGAGIGGGNEGNGSNITISGGTVTATSELGEGIGGGSSGSAENIKIAPAANTRIYAYNGSDNTGTALDGSPFTAENDITMFLNGNAFYSYAEHVHGWGNWISNSDGTHTRTCAIDASHTEMENCSGGNATCTEKAVCEVCGGQYDAPNVQHRNISDWFIYDNLQHRRWCLDCNSYESIEYENHYGGTATCIQLAVCEGCGTSYGTYSAHTWGEWRPFNSTGHMRDCTNPGCPSYEYDFHTGGDGSCSPKCADCGDFYIDVEGQHRNMSQWLFLNDEQHIRQCIDCGGSKAEYADHTGGIATCAEKAVCEVCAVAYGDTLPHTYGTEWKSDGTNHWHECTCGAKSGEAAHSGGTATCKDKAACSVCGVAYGELDSTKHAGGTEIKNAKDATCGEDGYTGDTYCMGCDEIAEKGTAIEATGEHTYGNWKVVKEATNTAKGEKQRTCSVCGHVDSEEIPMLSDIPATGDNSNIMLWSGMLCVCTLGLAVLLVDRKRRSTK